MQINQYWKLSSISVGFCFFLLKPLFLYWKLPQGPATVFIWGTCFLTNMFVPFPLVSCRCTCYHIYFFVFRSICSQLVFFYVISEHLFSYRFVCVFGCRSSCSHIVFSGFFRSICSLIVFFCCFSENLFSYRFILFFWLPQHLFSYNFNMKQPAAILVLPVL